METTILRSLRVLVKETVQPADLVIVGGLIAEVAPHGSQADGLELGNLLITPGFVDLHSDAVEKEIEPRPGASFAVRPSLIELDRKLAMAGITTMFHAVSFNDEALSGNRATEAAINIIREIDSANRTVLAVDNFIHARYEITSFKSGAAIKELIEDRCVKMVSIMDHSPGQGQFKTVQSWKNYHKPVFDISDEEADIIIGKKEQIDMNLAYKLMRELLVCADEHGLVALSHDDDRPEKIDMLKELGVSVTEFPLNIETAKYAVDSGIHAGMGAPNVVRGKSQSGNISARELVERGCCDFLCSDYHPASMLQAAWAMNREMGLDLGQAIGMISSVPAAISGLDDRGEIAQGLIADLLVIDDRDIPKVVTTMKEGDVIYSSLGCLCG